MRAEACHIMHAVCVDGRAAVCLRHSAFPSPSVPSLPFFRLFPLPFRPFPPDTLPVSEPAPPGFSLCWIAIRLQPFRSIFPIVLDLIPNPVLLPSKTHISSPQPLLPFRASGGSPAWFLRKLPRIETATCSGPPDCELINSARETAQRKAVCCTSKSSRRGHCHPQSLPETLCSLPPRPLSPHYRPRRAGCADSVGTYHSRLRRGGSSVPGPTAVGRTANRISDRIFPHPLTGWRSQLSIVYRTKQ